MPDRTEAPKVTLGIPPEWHPSDPGNSGPGSDENWGPDVASPAYQAGLRDGKKALDIVLGPGAIEHHLRSIIVNLGLDANGQHFARTPARVAKVLQTYCQPVDLEAILSTGFDETDDNVLVTQTNIPFMGLCAHHLLPFFGRAAVGYLPRQRVVGLSKLTRLVYAAGHRSPSTQEAITNDVADALAKSTSLNVAGAAVITTALHGCMAVRGVEAPATETTVSAVRGLFRDAPALRAEFTSIVSMAGRL